MRSNSGRGHIAGAVFALVLAAAGLAAAIDRFGTALPLPAFLAAVPILAGLAVAFLGRSLVARDVVGGTPAGEAETAGPATLVGAVALVAAATGVGLGGLDGLVLIAAFLAGGAMALFGVAPALARTGALTVAGAVRRRFGESAGALAALASLAALLPLLAAEAALAGAIARQTLGLDPDRTRFLVVAVAALAALVGGRRSAMLMAAALLPVVALGFLAPVAVAEAGSSGAPLPWLELADIGSSEAATRMPPPVAAVLALLLVCGLAALPTLAAPGRSSRASRGRLGGFAAAAAVLLAGPAYAALGRAAGIDAAANPAGLVLNFAAYAGLGAAPALLLAGGLIAASAMALALGLSALGATLAEDLYARHVERDAPEGRRAFIARLGVLAAAPAVLALDSGAGIATLAALGLSFAAAGLAPVLLVGWNIAATRGATAAAAIATGLAFVTLDLALVTLAPGLAGMLGIGRIAPTVLGPTGWFGLPVGTAGVAGGVLGLAMLGALGLVGRRPVRASAAAAPPLAGDAAPPTPETPVSGAASP